MDNSLKAVQVASLIVIAGFVAVLAVAMLLMMARLDLMARHIEQTQCIDEGDVL